MKKHNLFLIYVLIAYAVAIGIIFAVCNESIISRIGFIVGMCCMFVPNITAMLFIYRKMKRSSITKILTLSTIKYVFVVGNIVLFLIGVAVTIINNLILTIVLEGIAVLAYLLCLLRIFSVTKFIDTGDKKRREKVNFKRELADITQSYTYLCEDKDIIQQLKKLSEDFRFSDPASPDSLHKEEHEIYEKVVKLKEIITNGPKEEIIQEIEIISSLLKIRNDKCFRLK